MRSEWLGCRRSSSWGVYLERRLNGSEQEKKKTEEFASLEMKIEKEINREGFAWRNRETHSYKIW